MQNLVIGNTIIQYSIRESEKAKLKRIIIRPETVEVVVPKGTTENSINKFVEKHKGRIFFKRNEQLQKMEYGKEEKPSSYATGAKILHYGRMTGLLVEIGDVPDISIVFNSRFHIQIPPCFEEERVKQAIENWQKEQIREDALSFIEYYSEKLNLYPRGIRIKEQKHLWASCGKDKIINLNWKLIKFPKAVLEYVVIHELCHLKYRSHSKEFWRLVGSFLQDWQTCKKLLEK